MLSARLDATKSGLILVVVPVLFEIIFLCALVLVLHSAQIEFHRISTAKNLLLLIQNGQYTIGQSLALLGNTNRAMRPRQLEEIDRQIALFRRQKAALAECQYPAELAECKQAALDLFDRAIKFGEHTRAIYGNPKLTGPLRSDAMRPEGMSLLMDNQNMTSMLLGTAASISAQEPEEMQQFRQQLITVISAGLLCSVLVSWLSANFFTSAIVTSLARVSTNAQLIGAGRPLPQPQPGDTEIAILEKVLYDAHILLNYSRRKELSVLDNAADIICSLDEQLHFVAVGQACAAVWGYSCDELIGKSLIEILTPTTADSTRFAFDKIASTLTEGEVENIVICQDKSSKNSIWNVSWSGQEGTFVCVVHDVTALRAIEQLKRRFLSIAGHDLRSPLTSIGASLSLLNERKQLPQSCLSELDETGKNLVRLLELIEDLLALERFQSMHASIATACVSAYDVCVSAQESLSSMAEFHNITVVGPTGDAAISGDESHLVQAVSKLLSSAIQASCAPVQISVIPSGSDEKVEIRITYRSLNEELVAAGNLGMQLAAAIAHLHKGDVGVLSDGTAETGQRDVIYWIRLPAFEDAGDGGDEAS